MARIRRPLISRLSAAAFATLFAVTALAARPASVVAIDYGFAEYTYSSSTCAILKDPINMYYNMSMTNAKYAVETVVGWKQSIITSNQWFKADGVCNVNDYNRVDYILSPRDHTRLRQSPSLVIVAAPAHHDVWTGCGDVASSFDSARDAARTKLKAAEYKATWVFTNNTLAITQCDGRMTASDGWFVLVQL